MRRIAIALIAVGAMLLGASSAQGATLNEVAGIVYYVAGQGERNDIQVGVDSILGGTVNVYSFKDADANPIQVTGGRCELINAVGMCRQSGLSSFVIDARDRDDTITVSTAGTGIVPPLKLGALMIGGRGVDVLMGGLGNDILKGNDGRDSAARPRRRGRLQGRPRARHAADARRDPRHIHLVRRRQRRLPAKGQARSARPALRTLQPQEHL